MRASVFHHSWNNRSRDGWRLRHFRHFRCKSACCPHRGRWAIVPSSSIVRTSLPDIDEPLHILSPRRLEHDEGAVDVGAEISLWLLDRRHDVSACRQMEDPLRPRTGGRGGSAVGDVVFDNFQERITIVLLQIEPPADYKIVEHANGSFARNQTVD